jgi:hypothetical protein
MSPACEVVTLTELTVVLLVKKNSYYDAYLYFSAQKFDTYIEMYSISEYGFHTAFLKDIRSPSTYN